MHPQLPPGEQVPYAIGLTIDRSASMLPHTAAVRFLIRDFIFDQRIARPDADFRLLTFSDQCRELYHGPVANAGLQHDYQPQGGTALLDAFGHSISDLDTACATVAVVTDGEENCSHSYNSDTVRQLIAKVRGAEWQILFLAVTERAIQFALNLGIPRDCCVVYKPGATTFQHMGGILSDCIARHTTERQIGFDSTQRKLLTHGT